MTLGFVGQWTPDLAKDRRTCSKTAVHVLLTLHNNYTSNLARITSLGACGNKLFIPLTCSLLYSSTVFYYCIIRLIHHRSR